MKKELKDKFMEEFRDREFTLDEVVQWISPHIETDEKKAIEQYQKTICRNFIASFKDEKGIRHFFGFKTDDGMKYTFSSGKLDLEIAKLILKNLNSKQKGLYKASRKIRKGIHIFYGQVDMFDKHSLTQ